MLKNVAVVHERKSGCCGLIKLHDQVGPSVANLNRVLPTLILKSRSSVVLRQNLEGGAVYVKGMVHLVSGDPPDFNGPFAYPLIDDSWVHGMAVDGKHGMMISGMIMISAHLQSEVARHRCVLGV